MPRWMRDELALPEPIPDPGVGKRVKGDRYMTKEKGVCKWNGRQLRLDGSMRHSDHDGVCWNKNLCKWRGFVQDRSVRVGKNPKSIGVGSFVEEQACADAVAAKKVEIEAVIATKLHAMAQELAHTRGLPLRPDNVVDAAPDTAYYGEQWQGAGVAEAKVFGPMRYVRMVNNCVPDGFRFYPCCQSNLDSGKPCTQMAADNGKNCNIHGGGPKVGEGGASHCTHCKSIRIGQKRRLGNRLCAGCEKHLKAESEANGSEAPVKSQRWEDVVFELLLPLLTYADGTPFPPDQRDERKGGGLGTSKSKKRSRECGTTTNRFPDGLWVLRDDKSNRVVLVVIVEVDEDSHGYRDPTCESGKVDDTFQSLQTTLAKEGAARGAVARHDAQMIPIVTIRINPNAYDGPSTNLEDRVKAVAALANSYLHMDAAALATLQTHAPIVHVLYYHSKDGARNLSHYAAKAAEVGWAYTLH